MAQDEERRAEPLGGEVVLMVCMKCGREYQFEGGDSPPSDMKCEKCGNEVFREFDDTSRPGEEQESFRAETERDMDPDDAEGDTTPGDLQDLNNP